MRDYKKASELKKDNKILEGLRKAERLQKESKNVDYYKILGVPRTASQADIKKGEILSRTVLFQGISKQNPTPTLHYKP